MCLVQTRHQILCILHRLNLHLKEGWARRGKQKKHPPADADVHWIVEGGWDGEGETPAGRAKNEDLVPAQSWTFISFRQGPEAKRWRVPCRVRLRFPEGYVQKEANVTQPGPKHLYRLRAACAVQRPQKTGSWCGFLQRVSSGQRDADARTPA